MFENPKRGRQARDFTTNVPKILDLKSSSEQIFSENWRWVPLFVGETSAFSLIKLAVLIAVCCVHLNCVLRQSLKCLIFFSTVQDDFQCGLLVPSQSDTDSYDRRFTAGLRPNLVPSEARERTLRTRLGSAGLETGH